MESSNGPILPMALCRTSQSSALRPSIIVRHSGDVEHWVRCALVVYVPLFGARRLLGAGMERGPLRCWLLACRLLSSRANQLVKLFSVGLKWFNSGSELSPREVSKWSGQDKSLIRVCRREGSPSRSRSERAPRQSSSDPRPGPRTSRARCRTRPDELHRNRSRDRTMLGSYWHSDRNSCVL